MVRKYMVLAVLFVFAFSLSGCATAKFKQKDEEIQGLKNQISMLESQLQSRDEEINSLKEQASKQLESSKEVSAKRISKKRMIPEVKSRPTIKQIQIALQNAGYVPGPIDGRMGAQSKDAIKAFQKANNLPADGKVGKKTWELLKEYLYKKTK